MIHFVLHGSERALQPDSLSVVNYYSIFLSFIAMMAGVLLGGTYLALALLMTVLSLIYILTTEVLKRKLKNSLQTGFICNSLVSVFSMVFFAVFGVLCLNMINPNYVQYLLIAGAYVLLLAIYYLAITQSIRKDIYASAKKRAVNAAGAAAGGAGVAMILGQFFFADIEQTLALLIVSTIWFFCSIIFSLGTVNILKYYYCKKYNIEEAYSTSNPKKRVRKRLSGAKKALLIVLCIAILFFLIALSIGWLAQNGYIPEHL